MWKENGHGDTEEQSRAYIREGDSDAQLAGLHRTLVRDLDKWVC